MLLRGVLGAAVEEGSPLHDQAFQVIFQRFSLSPGRPRATTAEEVAVVEHIAAHLLRTRSRPGAVAGGREAQQSFLSLSRRLRLQPGLQDVGLRVGCLQMLYALRNGGWEREQPGAGHFGTADAVADPRAWRPPDPFGGRVAAAAVQPPRPGSSRQPWAAPRLGWRVTAGAAAAGAASSAAVAPIVLPESQLVRDLLHALQGVDSGCFKLRRGPDGSSHFEVDPAYVLARPAWTLAHKILELADLHWRLCAATNSALEAESGSSLLHQALCEALRGQLRDYYKVLAILMAKAGDSLTSGLAGGEAAGAAAAGAAQPEPLTLRRLWAWLQEPLERMRLLVELCDACMPLRGGALASTVYGFTRVGDAAAEEACLAILRRVVEPMVAMVRAWMTEGELRDPFGEFFVCADAAVQLEDLWQRMYFLEVEMVPCFVPLELARKILLTGKSVNFIRLCCPGKDWLPAGGGRRRSPLALPDDPHSAADVPAVAAAAAHPDASATAGAATPGTKAPPLPLVELTARVEEAALQTNKHLVSLMMDQYALGDHCLALRRFLLLSQGDFAESLLDNVEAELGKEATQLYRHQLMGVVDMAVRQSNAQYGPPDTIARLGVKLLTPSAGERGWDTFLLEYAIGSPLHVVFEPRAMQQYERAFVFLWKLRRVSHTLASCWSQHMALQRHLVSCGQQLMLRAPELGLEMRQTLHKCGCLRNEMHHFVQNVQSYVMCGVLESSWAKLQADWRACTDLDQVIAEHRRYLECIEDGAFLSPSTEPILSALLALFGLVLELTELHDQVCANAFEAVDVLSREPDGPLPFARGIAEARAKLDQIGANFLARFQSLLRTLEAQATQPTLQRLETDLRFLLCRLDFNGYYEQKRITPWGGSGERS